jgi:hypothetical protein
LFPIVAGGILYSVGAAINLLGKPVLWPEVLRSHELFHLLVVAGSLAHYWFMLSVVAPFVYEPEVSSLPSASVPPRRAFGSPPAVSQAGG